MKFQIIYFCKLNFFIEPHTKRTFNNFRDDLICGHNNSMCRQYHEIENKLNCVNCINDISYLNKRNVTAYSMNRTSKTIKYENKSNPYIHSNRCSRNDELFNKIRNSSLANETSFSPWEYIINFDENRFDWNKFLTCVLFF